MQTETERITHREGLVVELGFSGDTRTYHFRGKVEAFTNFSEIHRIPGVIKTISKPGTYHITITKAKAFQWAEIEPKVVAVLEEKRFIPREVKHE